MRNGLTILGFIFIASVSGQETTGALPPSVRFGLDTHDLPTLQAAPFDADLVAADDRHRDADGDLSLYARFVVANASLDRDGLWTELPDGSRIWRVRVLSTGAQAMELFFSDTYLPQGAQVYVYDEHAEQVLGGYTKLHVTEGGHFSTGMVFGEACIVEYEEPAEVRGEGSLHLVKVAHAYRNVLHLNSGACNVDVNCSEGGAWADQRDAVVRIRVVVPAGTGFCTGVLMNNTARDCKGYILTAFHCTRESVEASEHFGNYIFRFQFQRTTCATGSATGNEQWGCVPRADSNDEGGYFGSDYSLLELINPIPASYNPYWAGWDIGGQPPASGVCIHHPDGDVKKISTFSSAAGSGSWSGFTANSHWITYWESTANGSGVTEPGSSGSPIFDPEKRVVGTLTGGASCCTVNGCPNPPTGPDYPDYFGRMDYHFWENNPNTTEDELHWWLSPQNGPDFLDGSRNPCEPIGMDELSEGMPELFPNPVTDLLIVRVPQSLLGADRLDVRDPTGRLVHSQKIPAAGLVEVDVTQWANGSYLLSVGNTRERSLNAKFTVVR